MFVEFIFIIEAITEQMNRGNVFQLISRDKYVFLFFYAEGCPHCALVHPIWKQIERIYNPVSSLIISSINCDKYKSTCFGLDYSSTPSIMFFRPHERIGSLFGGNKTIISFSKFILKEAGIEPYSSPESLIYLSKDQIEKLERPAFFVFDNPRNQKINHSELIICENNSEFIIHAVSVVEYPDVAKNHCGNATSCISFQKRRNIHIRINGSSTCEALGNLFKDSDI